MGGTAVAITWDDWLIDSTAAYWAPTVCQELLKVQTWWIIQPESYHLAWSLHLSERENTQENLEITEKFSDASKCCDMKHWQARDRPGGVVAKGSSSRRIKAASLKRRHYTTCWLTRRQRFMWRGTRRCKGPSEKSKKNWRAPGRESRAAACRMVGPCGRWKACGCHPKCSGKEPFVILTQGMTSLCSCRRATPMAAVRRRDWKWVKKPGDQLGASWAGGRRGWWGGSVGSGGGGRAALCRLREAAVWRRNRKWYRMTHFFFPVSNEYGKHPNWGPGNRGSALSLLFEFSLYTQPDRSRK